MKNKIQLTDDFQFESKFIEINKHNLHYIDVGQGDPVLFIHGNPTSSYLWRNIIPYLSKKSRCIAIDLIGFGQSERPDIDYTFPTHSNYIHKFIKKLNLKKITLVMHDWGCALGFHYGLHHLENIKGFAFLEAGSWFQPLKNMDEFHPKEAQSFFSVLRDPIKGPELMKSANPFLANLQKNILGRNLSEKAWEYYKKPFINPDSRKPMWMFPTQFPIAKEPLAVHQIVDEFSSILQNCSTPKIMFYADPGCNTPPEIANWAKQNIKNLKSVDIGKGFHFLPEDNPILIGEELRKWYERF